VAFTNTRGLARPTGTLALGNELSSWALDIHAGAAIRGCHLKKSSPELRAGFVGPVTISAVRPCYIKKKSIQ
jgi:hypothetical protein